MPWEGHKSYPRHTTIHDLVKRCPGCGETVSWPYTQDPLSELREMKKTGKSYIMSRYRITEVEAEIMRDLGYEFEAYSVGAIIKTVKTVSGVLWHEPCYVVRYAREWQKHMKSLVDLLSYQIMKAEETKHEEEKEKEAGNPRADRQTPGDSVQGQRVDSEAD